jgi:hypothetical protein
LKVTQAQVCAVGSLKVTWQVDQLVPGCPNSARHSTPASVISAMVSPVTDLQRCSCRPPNRTPKEKVDEEIKAQGGREACLNARARIWAQPSECVSKILP